MALVPKGIRNLKNELKTKNKDKKRQKTERWTKVISWGSEKESLHIKYFLISLVLLMVRSYSFIIKMTICLLSHRH